MGKLKKRGRKSNASSTEEDKRKEERGGSEENKEKMLSHYIRQREVIRRGTAENWGGFKRTSIAKKNNERKNEVITRHRRSRKNMEEDPNVFAR